MLVAGRGKREGVTMNKKQHRSMCRKLAKYLFTNVPSDLNILGVEAALLMNLGLTISGSTLKVIYSDYKKLLTK